MAATAPTLGGTTLAHPYSFQRQAAYRGGRRVMSDGTIVTDLVASGAKRRFTLDWRLLTSAQLTNIETAFASIDDSSGAFVSPENVNYTVTQDDREPDLGVTVMYYNGTARYNVHMVLREV